MVQAKLAVYYTYVITRGSKEKQEVTIIIIAIPSTVIGIMNSRSQSSGNLIWTVAFRCSREI